MNTTRAAARFECVEFGRDDRAFAWCVTLTFALVVASSALQHVMWRDEWIPLTIARHTEGYANFFSEIRYLGRNGFFSFVWLLDRVGGLAVFKFVLIAISICGVYVFVRHSPFTRLQKTLFAFGYYPLYEYGTILRDYGALLTLSLAVMTLLSIRTSRPLAFGIVIALLAQTNAFGVILAAVFCLVFLTDLWRRGLLTRAQLTSAPFLSGAALACASMAYAGAGFMQPPEITRAVMGADPRTDSHWVRLIESAPFAFRAWFPLPVFGAWNSQLLDPWPVVQIVIVIILAIWMLFALRPSFIASVTLVTGMIAMAAIHCHLPWTALRYHGPYFIVLLMAWWLAERDDRWDESERTDSSTPRGLVAWITSPAVRRSFLTAVLAVHAVVGITFVVQERLVPFSGSREAATLIREREPADVLVVVDPDYAATSLAGYLGREVFIAGRDEPGAFTKVDQRRRLGRLSPEELSGVIQRKLRDEKRDLVLVTNYEVMMPPEMGTLLGVTPSITDERYYVFRMRYRRSTP